MEAGVERLASAGRALDKVRTGLKLVDTVLKIGEGAGLPLIPAVCSAARGVLQVVQASRTVINDVLSAAQRTIDVLELLQLMAQNVKRMDVTSRASVEDRMRELQRLLEDVRLAVATFGKKLAAARAKCEEGQRLLAAGLGNHQPARPAAQVLQPRPRRER